MNMGDFLNLNWPSAGFLTVVVFFFLFRKAILDVIPRIRKASRNGIELNQVPVQNPEDPVHLFVNEDRERATSPVLVKEMEAIRNDIKNRHIEDPNKVVDSLVRQLAIAQVSYRFELIYATTWGSQIELLQHLNALGEQGATLSWIHAFYDSKASSHPDVFSGYPFEAFIRFLVTQGLAKQENGRLVISDFGQEFLTYLVQMQKSMTKAY